MLRSPLPRFLIEPDPLIYLRNDYVTLDFETTTIGKGLSVYSANRIVSVAWRCGPDHSASSHIHREISDYTNYKRSGEFELDELVQACQEASFIVAHNAKFELGWLDRCGLDIGEVLVYDTLLGEYVLGGNRWKFHQLGLESIGQKRLGEGKVSIVSRMIKAGIPTEDIPEEWLEEYCIQDVELTERIFLQQRGELKEKGLLPVLYNRCLLTPVLADIEKNGMQLDTEAVTSLSHVIEQEYLAVTNELNRTTGGIDTAGPKKLGEYLYDTLGFDEVMIKRNGQWVPDRTKTKMRKTDQETIGKLRAKTEKQKAFLSLYKRQKEKFNELTKYLRKFADCCSGNGGLLLASFNQAATRTHRLSSSGLDYTTQFQNFPREYKPIFCSRHTGWLIGECDASGAEFRTAVHQGRDPIGLYDIISGTDVHSVTASIIGCSRQDAKLHTFKPLYGGQSGTDSERRYYQYFRDKYRGITATQRSWIDTVLNDKCLRTEWGLIYYWPDTEMDRSGYVKNSTSICNYPVQALATAEILPMALVWFWHRLRRSGLKMFIVNTIHDSIVVELPPEEQEAFTELSKQCMIEDSYYMLRKLYGIEFTVPLGTGIKIGSHWGTGEEIKYTAPEEYWKEAARKEGMLEKIED